MVIVEPIIPDIENFIDWKVLEEQKVAALVAGSKLLAKHLNLIIKACVNCRGDDATLLRPAAKPGAEARDQSGAQVAITITRSSAPSSRARAIRKSTSRSTTPIGTARAVLHRFRPELEQLRSRQRRVPESSRERRATGG